MSDHAPNLDFIREIITDDLATGKHATTITRFPPEPNGYLHIGHAKSICLNFGVAQEFGGVCHLRFDDTNPEKEDVEYVNSIRDAIQWLGFDWNGSPDAEPYQASDYFDFMYRAAEYLIEAGHAYVDEQTVEQILSLIHISEPTRPY